MVTGASQGIGLAIVEALAEAGADVAMAARRKDRLEAIRDSHAAASGGLRPAPVDLSDTGSIGEFCAAELERTPKLDVLVLCGGVYKSSSWTGDDADNWESMLEVNVLGNARVIRGLLPALERAKGHVVFINSSIVRGSGAGNPAFAACQHALKSLSDSLRDRVNASGVRVTSVYPGKVATPRQRAIAETTGRTYEGDRIVQPEDIAATVLHCVTFPSRAEITDVHVRQTEKI